MTNEKKQEFTRRISQANQSELVVILYDLFFYYIDEAQQALEKEGRKAFRVSLNRAHDCLNELILSLHMETDLAKAIYQVYLFVSRKIGQAAGSCRAEELSDAVRLMRSLYETYKTDAVHDTSEPVMNHSQAVYAGLTYGRDCHHENQAAAENRGFYA